MILHGLFCLVLGESKSSSFRGRAQHTKKGPRCYGQNTLTQLGRIVSIPAHSGDDTIRLDK